jgi:hypothetical protein
MYLAFQCIYEGEGSHLKVVNSANTTISPAYLEPNRNTMQKPVEGPPALTILSTKKQSQHKKTEGKGTKKTIGAYPKVQPINKGPIVSQRARKDNS